MSSQIPAPLSSRSRLANAAALVMALFVASRALGLLREIVIARQFGTGAALDAYLAAFRLPDFLFYVIAGGALGSAFIPTFASYLEKEGTAEAWRLASATINWVLLILGVAGAMAALLAPQIVALITGFPPAQQALTVVLMRWLLISTVVFGVSGVVMGVLQTRGHFLLPALAPVLYNLGIIGGALWLGPVIGVLGPTLGAVAGALLHLLVQVPGLWRQGMVYTPTLARAHPGLRQVARLMGPRVIGLAAVQLNFVVNVFLASGLSEGSLSALNFGWIIMLLPQGVIAQAVATVAFPTFSTLVAREAWAELRRTFVTTLRGVLYLTLPAAVGLILLREPIIVILLKRGAFDARSVELTAWALGLYTLGLVGHAVVEISARMFYALHNTRTPVLVGLGAMTLNIVLSVVWLRLFAGFGWPPHGGLALANSLAVTLEMIVLLVLLKRPLSVPGGAEAEKMPAVAWRMGGAALGMALSLILLTLLVSDRNPWLLGSLGIVIGGGVYGGLTLWLGLDEPRAFSRRLLRRFS
ncbi:MAG: murein biosynthesis integral membrane protein MurJ [Anaerolineae bacterium]